MPTTPDVPRFGRDYELLVQVPGYGAVRLRPPFQITFSAEKSTKPTLNRLTCRVYNLAPQLRGLLVRDPEQDDDPVPVSLSVGYQGVLGAVFVGTLTEAYSDREGGDYYTHLVALDGGDDWRRGFVSAVVASKEEAIDAILAPQQRLKKGAIGAFQNSLARARVIMDFPDAAADGLLEAGQSFFIADEKLYILGRNEVVGGAIPVVRASTGLLRTPEGQKNTVTFSSVLNPAVRVGGLCELRSKVAPQYDGVYRVDKIVYSGDYEGQEWEQEITGSRIEEWISVREA